jgi:prepilin-type N-terminal cleavage/methylation domain-containing protein
MMSRVKRAGGFTLMEILVVMALISVLMGLGIGMYRSMSSLGKGAQARNTLVETIQMVKVSSWSWPAELVVDPAGNRVYGREFRTFASCNFEPSTAEGADPADIIGVGVKNGRILGDGILEGFPSGHTGGGLVLELGGADFGNYADYDVTHGVSLDISVYPTQNRDMFLVRKGKSYGLMLDQASGDSGPVVVGYLSLGTVEDLRKNRVNEPVRFRVDDYPLMLNRWNRIVMNYERSRVTIAIDSWDRGPVPRLSVEEKEERYILPDRNEHLLVGDGGRRGITGRVDDLKMAGIFPGELRSFPEEITVAWIDPQREAGKQEVSDEILRVRFLNGKLDPAYHQSEVSFLLKYKGEAQKLTIGLLGNILVK